MTLTCPGPACPRCAGSLCNVCQREGRPEGDPCTHDSIERHMGIPAIAPEPVELAVDRVPTVPLDKPLLAGRIEVDLADGEAVASFLELVARVARVKGKLIVIVE